MGIAVDMLYNAFVRIQDNHPLFLDYEFIVTIFNPLYSIPEFAGNMNYNNEEKNSNVIGADSAEDRV